MSQSPFGAPEGFDPQPDDAGSWNRPIPPGPVRRPGEEVWSGVDVTPQAPSSARKRGRTVAAVAGTTVLVSALAVGGTFAVNALGGGGGDRPEQHLPGNTMAMAELDLDPSLGQKVDAVRFLSRLPQARSKVKADSDLREVLYRSLTEDVRGAPTWDQSKAWLGSRVAVAALPGGDAKHPVEPVVLIQVSDDQAARDGLGKGAGRESAVSVHDGWAVVARTQEIADRVAATEENASLSADGTFQADLAKLGETGIVTGWVDAKAAMSAFDTYANDPGLLGRAGIAGEDLTSLQDFQRALGQVHDQLGHGAVALRFDGPQLEVAMAITGGRTTPDRGPSGIGDLPADSIFALSATGLGEQTGAAWPKNGDSDLAGMAAGLGLKLPEDLAALLGTRTQLVLGKFDASSVPAVGVRATSSDPGLPRALAALAKLSKGEDSFVQLHQQRIKGGYVLSTDQQQLTALATGVGGLGAKPGFASVLPDAATAQTAAYVDLAAFADVLSGFGEADPDSADEMKLLKELGAAGVTARTEPDGTARISLRIGVK